MATFIFSTKAPTSRRMRSSKVQERKASWENSKLYPSMSSQTVISTGSRNISSNGEKGNKRDFQNYGVAN
jgi:hypothetical protein